LAALITYAVSGISGIWLLKTDGMPLITVDILDVVGRLDFVTALLFARRG
jgi:hypothetical protein